MDGGVDWQTDVKADLFEHIFVKPSALQDALLQPPHTRSVEQVATIASTLRLVPFVAALNKGLLDDLAMCIGEFVLV